MNTPRVFLLEEAGSQKFAVLPRNFCDPASSNQNNSGGRGGVGGVTGKEKNPHDQCKGFSNPHTDFGEPRSRRLGINLATN